MAQPVDKVFHVNKRVSFGVKIAGKGDPVVFLHHAGGLDWDPFLDELSDHYTVYAPHLPGTSSSTGLENIKDLWDLVLCYYDLFDQLGLESVDIIGHSLGGMIAAELAATDPKRVKRLVAAAPFGLFREDYPIPDIFAMLPHEFTDRLVFDKQSALAERLNAVPKENEEKLNAMIHRIENMQAAAKFLWPIPDKGLKHRIYRIKAPTLLIWGKQDGVVPVIYAEEFHSQIPHSEVKIVDNASHLVTIEQTGEVMGYIRDFLQTENVSAFTP